MSSTCIEGKPALFTAIVAPTGTGKTQLAATASLEKDNVRYLLCEGSVSDLVQPFYKPHNDLAFFLLKALTHLRLQFSDKLNHFKGASAYVQWFSKEEVSSPLVTLIHRILFPESPNLEDGLSFGALRKIILERQSKFLVFLDEVPPSGQLYHAEIVLFRDLLRAVGICPTLMSTHSGAQNAVMSGPGSSKTDENTKWCHLITRLPQFHSSKSSSEMPPYLCASERPLVALYMSEMAHDASIDEIIKTVRQKLQSKKRTAWLSTPVFQLCQLFRTSKDVNSLDHTTHRLVGKHFGYLVNPSNYSAGHHSLLRSQAGELRFRVQMVLPREEPVLFTALLSWSNSSITQEGGTSNDVPLFPLVDGKGKAISVRAAYDMNAQLFQPSVPSVNPEAVKLSGDLLEVTSLASVCLASMNSDDGVGKGVLLPKFLSCIFYFMQPEDLHYPDIDARRVVIDRELRQYSKSHKFAGMRVPCCSSADSPYPVEWRQFNNLFRGNLKRPRDAEKRDGWVGRLKDEGTIGMPGISASAGDYLDFLQIECKNYLSGVDKTVFSNVVKRVRPICLISILFASSLNDIFTDFDSWIEFTRGTLEKPHQIAFLTLGANEVSWLTVEKGGVSLAPTEDTELLFVVVETGPVH